MDSGIVRGMGSAPRLRGAVLGLAAGCAVATALADAPQYPMPGYFADIQEWAATGHIGDTFTPLAYPLFAGPAYRVAGVPGIVWLQALLYVGLVVVAIRLLSRLGLPDRWAALGALPVLLHPEYVLSIPKVWDVDLSVFLLLLFALMCLAVQGEGMSAKRSIGLGLVAGAGIFCRPNYALMLPVVLYAAWTSPGATVRRTVLSLSTVLMVAAATFVFLGWCAHGRPFVPRNGPYNLFAGNNPYAGETLLTKLNAEPSIPEAFAAEYPKPLPDTSAAGFFYSPALEPFYNHASADFALHHPAEEVELVAIKLWTLFRPDTKVHRAASADGMGKVLLALPALGLVVLLVLTRRAGLTRQDRLLVLAYAGYVLPFLITNSDPRFRIPLDAMLLLHGLRRLYLLREGPTAGSCAQCGRGLASFHKGPGEYPEGVIVRG